jgi:hypothetical protein
VGGKQRGRTDVSGTTTRPHLKRLSLQRFQSDDADYVIAFLARHAQLESLSLLGCRGRWLSCEFDARDRLSSVKESVKDPSFLPNLKHLKVRRRPSPRAQPAPLPSSLSVCMCFKFSQARFDDIRALLSVLPRLVSLSFTESYNCQVPYLLRELLPDALPALQSLEIAQAVGDPMEPYLEGVRWSERAEGGFRIEKN